MAPQTVTTLDPVLKQHYTSDVVKSMVYKRQPFLAAVAKMTAFGGRNLPIPIEYATGAGRSAAFATAQANISPVLYESFDITRVSDYSLGRISNEAMLASQGDKNAFLQGVVGEMNGAIRAATLSLGAALFRSGSGALATISNNPSTSLTLTNASSSVHFFQGMKLVASATAGGALRSDGPATVTGVDRDTGVITITGTVTDWDIGDTIYQQGDAQAGGTALKISGLSAWLPSSAPSSSSFFGVDRTVDTHLSGVRYDASSQTIKEGLIDCAARVAREGGEPDTVWMNPMDWAKLEKELASDVVFDIVKSDNGKFGFRSIVLNAPTGPINVVSDRNCPEGRAYMLQMDTWKLYSLGEAPMVLTYNDGAGRWLRVTDADQVELRVGYYAQLGCSAPGWNATITLPT